MEYGVNNNERYQNDHLVLNNYSDERETKDIYLRILNTLEIEIEV